MTVCPVCGTGMVGVTGVGSPGARSGTVAAGGRPPAWEDPGVAFPRNLLDTWRESVTKPGTFFGGVRYETAAARPLLYYLIISIVAATFSLWWSAARTAVDLPRRFPGPDPWLPVSPTANALITFFATPFAAIVGLILWSTLLHALIAVVARDRRGYGATMRVLCYASGPQVMSIVPVVGALAGLVWSLALVAIGLREAHRTTTAAALGVVIAGCLVPLAILVAVIISMAAALAALA